MSYEAIRANVATRVETAKTAWLDYALKVQFDNRDMVDLQSQVLPFVMMDLDFRAAEQADLNRNPRVQIYGTINIVACCKFGDGTSKVLKLVDHFIPYFELTGAITPIQTKAAAITPSRTFKGWYAQPLVIPFWSTRTSTLAG